MCTSPSGRSLCGGCGVWWPVSLWEHRFVAYHGHVFFHVTGNGFSNEDFAGRKLTILSLVWAKACCHSPDPSVRPVLGSIASENALFHCDIAIPLRHR